MNHNLEKNKNLKILITGVHFTPAIAVLEELESRGYTNFVWVGRKYPYILGLKDVSLEYKIITSKGIPFINLITGKIQRTLDITFFKWIIRIPIGFIQAFFVIQKEKPDIIVTFGSYIGVPIAFWGWIFRKKIILHEQTVVTGLSTSVISKFADIICTSWNIQQRKSQKYVYTGNPIQKSIFEVKSKEINFSNTDRKTLLFIAGKAGSHVLNVNVFGAISNLCKKYNVIHQTGTNNIADDYQDAKSLAEEINVDGIKYIPLQSYQGGEVYQKASIVIGRSGANTIYELAALGKVSVLIPIPFTQKNEQAENAKLLESYGTAKVLHQNVLAPDTLINTINDVVANYEVMVSKTLKAKSLVVLDADKRIANIIEKVLILLSNKISDKTIEENEIHTPEEKLITTKNHTNLKTISINTSELISNFAQKYLKNTNKNNIKISDKNSNTHLLHKKKIKNTKINPNSNTNISINSNKDKHISNNVGLFEIEDKLIQFIRKESRIFKTSVIKLAPTYKIMSRKVTDQVSKTVNNIKKINKKKK